MVECLSRFRPYSNIRNILISLQEAAKTCNEEQFDILVEASHMAGEMSREKKNFTYPYAGLGEVFHGQYGVGAAMDWVVLEDEG